MREEKMKIGEEKTRRRRKKYKRQVHVIQRRNLFSSRKNHEFFPLFHPLSSTNNDDPITVERDYYSFSNEREERKRDDDQHKIAWRALYSWKRKKSLQKTVFTGNIHSFMKQKEWEENELKIFILLVPRLYHSHKLFPSQTFCNYFFYFSSKVDHHLIMIMIVYWNQFNKQEKWGGGGEHFPKKKSCSDKNLNENVPRGREKEKTERKRNGEGRKSINCCMENYFSPLLFLSFILFSFSIWR